MSDEEYLLYEGLNVPTISISAPAAISVQLKRRAAPYTQAKVRVTAGLEARASCQPHVTAHRVVWYGPVQCFRGCEIRRENAPWQSADDGGGTGNSVQAKFLPVEESDCSSAMGNMVCRGARMPHLPARLTYHTWQA